MDFKKLITLSYQSDIRIDSFRSYSRSIPYYYNSLRHAFGFYFNTFISNNSGYAFYAEGLSRGNLSIFKRQVLDEDNTVLTLINFERFFELYLKNLLATTHKKLTQVSSDKSCKGTAALINAITNGSFEGARFENKLLSIPFREVINRFYDLIALTKNQPNSSSIVKRFNKVIRKYSFFDSTDCEATFRYLNWYRDRILHNGNKLPSMWLLDYTITQRVIPIVREILHIEQPKMNIDFYYLKTLTGIDILEELCSVKFQFRDLKSKKKKLEVFYKLLKIGHLKELGRANMNMNLYVRKNKATYEYNYKDPIGRGQRFAEAEKAYPDFKEISNCPCCGIKSLVTYLIQIDDFFNPGKMLNIDWVKCYTCDYHLRFDTGDPYLLQYSYKPLFTIPNDATQ